MARPTVNPAEVPPIPWSLLSDVGLTIVKHQPTSGWYWGLDPIPNLDTFTGPFATPLDALRDALTALVALGRELLGTDIATLPLLETITLLTTEGDGEPSLTPHTRDGQRWNGLAIDDEVRVTGLLGTWRVAARSPHDDDRVLLEHPVQPQLRVEAFAQHCQRLLPPLRHAPTA